MKSFMKSLPQESPFPRGGPRLTRREVECLQLLSQGYQAKRIGHMLGLEPKTIEHYVAAARRKLCARTTTHAVAIAISRGLLVSVATISAGLS